MTEYIQINPLDNVAVALRPLLKGGVIEINGEGIVPVCLYYETLGSQLVSDIRNIRIIENGM